MAASESQFRLGVFASCAALVVVIAYLRFCGSLSLPAKPPPPAGPTGTERQLLAKSTGTPAVYQSFVERDAAAAGVKVPSIDDMGRKFAYRVDEARHVIEPGHAPIEVAGLRLHVEKSGDAAVLVMQNMAASDVAYEVSTAPGGATCEPARPLPFNAMVIAKGASETRTECEWRDGMTIVATKVETIEIPPLSSWLLSHVPPELVGIDERIARGHHVEGRDKCSTVMAARVRSGIENGNIGWRDLADFYARHRCMSYQFPPSYRAFKSDGERQLPAVDASL
jgi:hypothetical protein